MTPWNLAALAVLSFCLGYLFGTVCRALANRSPLRPPRTPPSPPEGVRLQIEGWPGTIGIPHGGTWLLWFHARQRVDVDGVAVAPAGSAAADMLQDALDAGHRDDGQCCPDGCVSRHANEIYEANIGNGGQVNGSGERDGDVESGVQGA